MYITLINWLKLASYIKILASSLLTEFMTFFFTIKTESSLSISFTSEYISILTIYFFLFFSGLAGIIFNYRNYFFTLINIEIMYLGVTACFIITSIIQDSIKGQAYALLLIIVTASESAIGLGILVVLNYFGKTIAFKDYQYLKG